MTKEAITAVDLFVAALTSPEKQVPYIVHSRDEVLEGGGDLNLDSIDMSSSVFIKGWSNTVKVGYIDHTSGLFLSASRIEIGSQGHCSLVFVGPNAKDVLIKDLSNDSKLVVPKGVKVIISRIFNAEGPICEYDSEAFPEECARWVKRLKMVQEIVKQDQEEIRQATGHALLELARHPHGSPWKRLPESV